MPPLIPRLHLFEIDDQPWFPAYLRARVQDGLSHTWTVHMPVIQPCSAATLVANVLQRILGASISKYTFIDFCAGAGGPTPAIERALNASLAASSRSDDDDQVPSSSTTAAASSDTPSYATVTARSNGHTNGKAAVPGSTSSSAVPTTKTVDFVLTDLHPHPDAWARLAKASAHITYEPSPVDASAAPASLISRYKSTSAAGDDERRVFRLFNLAFHHFDDPLASAIVRNTVETSDGFGIFELQERTLASFFTCVLYGFFIAAVAPFYYWWSPSRLFLVYIFPIVPFVLVFDGFVSALRTRTPEEVEKLLRECGAEGAENWVVESGRDRFLWPVGYMNWVVCTKKT